MRCGSEGLRWVVLERDRGTDRSRRRRAARAPRRGRRPRTRAAQPAARTPRWAERVGGDVAVVRRDAAHSSSPRSARTDDAAGRPGGVERGEACDRVGIARVGAADRDVGRNGHGYILELRHRPGHPAFSASCAGGTPRPYIPSIPLAAVNLALAAYMTGVIWVVQVVPNPQLAQVRAADLPASHAAHSRRITPVVAPAMLAHPLVATALLVDRPGPLVGGQPGARCRAAARDRDRLRAAARPAERRPPRRPPRAAQPAAHDRLDGERRRRARPGAQRLSRGRREMGGRHAEQPERHERDQHPRCRRRRARRR